ncbi:hypothetical protein K466DRAFT_28275 [Polyporus arcularius HHB13444]|uniref:Uncharacterized protein n=1 Tax=Polyporus arcularius HHB13444 TaxID=1314778 RepID=A0A5C3PTJ2_9APHY|nr:hypothetical protein K466DRAFT_28275 [Polyporus arcularius HHB13444]
MRQERPADFYVLGRIEAAAQWKTLLKKLRAVQTWEQAIDRRDRPVGCCVLGRIEASRSVGAMRLGMGPSGPCGNGRGPESPKYSYRNRIYGPRKNLILQHLITTGSDVDPTEWPRRSISMGASPSSQAEPTLNPRIPDHRPPEKLYPSTKTWKCCSSAME